VQCGVPAAAYAVTDDLFRLDDVCWHYRAERGSTVWTTVDREVAVLVTVPGPAAGASQWTIAFSRAVIQTVPRLKELPSGCASMAEPLPTASS